MTKRMKRRRGFPHRHMDMGMHQDDVGDTKIVQGPASRTRSRSTPHDKSNKKKRKLKSPVIKPPRSNSSSTNVTTDQGEEEPIFERDPPNKSQPSPGKRELGSASEGHNNDRRHSDAPWIPDKRTLQLILDKLQREDSYEIFAEPVDPDQVADYYVVIKEPMDFGTMRAKLHEGLYKNLEEFERDVFLIPQNAMRFNSSGTIFFKQAREIEDLAKKVFHLLKTDPKKLESELSETRQRASKRIRGKSKVSAQSQSHRAATPKSSRAKYHESSKSKLSSFSKFSTIGATTGNLPTSSSPCHLKDHGIFTPSYFTGPEEARKCNALEADRCQTYRPPPSSLHENCAAATSGIKNNSKLLIQVNQQHNGYTESLMLFVKDLGPTARRVATGKLHGLSAKTSNSPNSVLDFSSSAQMSPSPVASDLLPQRLTTPHTPVMTPLSRALLNIPDHELVSAPEKISEKTSLSKRSKDQNGSFIVVSGLLAVKTQRSSAKNMIHSHSSSSREARSSTEMSIIHASEGCKGNQNQKPRIQLQSSSTAGNARKPKVSGELELNHEVHRSELLGRAAINSAGLRMNQAVTQVPHFGGGGGGNVASIPHVTNHLGFNLPLIPQGSQFAYNIPYLRTRLSQAMNLLGNSNSNK